MVVRLFEYGQSIPSIDSTQPAPARIPTRLYTRWATRIQWGMGCGLLALLGGMLITAPSLAQTDRFTVSALQRSEACIDALYHIQARPIETTPISSAQATEICQQALMLTQVAGDRRLEAYIQGNLGTLALQQQQYAAARQHYDRTLQLAESIADSDLQVKALIAIGSTETHLSQFESAILFYQQALNLAQAQNDAAGMAIAYYNLGLAYDQLSDPIAATAAYQQATLKAQSIEDVMLEVLAAQKLQLAQQRSQDSIDRQISIR
ncbi:MAG: tetratricopeptide repeat protein [Elainella sp. Prado103]|nr:tetratricopeptide repeat protein [Elainella sp. Prado103]